MLQLSVENCNFLFLFSSRRRWLELQENAVGSNSFVSSKWLFLAGTSHYIKFTGGVALLHAVYDFSYAWPRTCRCWLTDGRRVNENVTLRCTVYFVYCSRIYFSAPHAINGTCCVTLRFIFITITYGRGNTINQNDHPRARLSQHPLRMKCLLPLSGVR